jgi:hypothetical protein
MWTPDALSSEARVWSGTVWRAVESQSRAATMRLVDTLEDQEILEGLLEDNKPPLPEACRDLHYLLATPFRYAPYPGGSRFRRAGQRAGAYYASADIRTALAELAFHRLLFYRESPDAALPRNPVEHTGFAVDCGTDRLLDLDAPPLDRDADTWMAREDYAGCQALADAAREAGLEILRTRSVRDPDQGHDLTLLSPAAFCETAPHTHQTWHVFVRPDRVQVWCEAPRQRHEFTVAGFAADSRVCGVPAP